MDDKMRKIPINLQIAGTLYPLKINWDEEEMYREAAKQVNHKLNAYRSHFQNQGLEPEKFIGMVAFAFSLETLRQKQRNDTAPYIEKIKELTEVLEDAFKKE
jgi:cell division protein ZapA